MDPRNHTLRHIIITLFKIKDERILKASREKKTVTYKGVPIKLSAYFSKETLQARRDWKEIFKVMKDKGLHSRLPYPEELSFRMEGQCRVSGVSVASSTRCLGNKGKQCSTSLGGA